jgi:hypothetical protein
MGAVHRARIRLGQRGSGEHGCTVVALSEELGREQCSGRDDKHAAEPDRQIAAKNLKI